MFTSKISKCSIRPFLLHSSYDTLHKDIFCFNYSDGTTHCGVSFLQHCLITAFYLQKKVIKIIFCLSSREMGSVSIISWWWFISAKKHLNKINACCHFYTFLLASIACYQWANHKCFKNIHVKRTLYLYFIIYFVDLNLW